MDVRWKSNNRVVPPPHERPSLIQKVHSKLEHFGVKRIYNLFTPHYHWRGMYVQVLDIIARCEQCDRVRTSFSFQQLTLSPFPIQGMFCHWSCDLAGELPQTSRGNVYIMIMIEHFSKWVELVALPDKSSHNISQAFLQQVLSRFRAGLSALLIKDQNSGENSKTYLTMLSLTIIKLQKIIPKLMALQRGWFKRAKRDFGIFASLKTKRIET